MLFEYEINIGDEYARATEEFLNGLPFEKNAEVLVKTMFIFHFGSEKEILDNLSLDVIRFIAPCGKTDKDYLTVFGMAEMPDWWTGKVKEFIWYIDRQYFRDWILPAAKMAMELKSI